LYDQNTAVDLSIVLSTANEIVAYAGGQSFVGPVISTNTLYHVALAKARGAVSLYLNGVKVASRMMYTCFRCSSKPTIGCYAGTSNFFAGQIDELRIIKGIAKYSANFTPPTAPFDFAGISSGIIYTLENFYELTTVLRGMRGGWGGSGGYGGGYNSSNRSTGGNGGAGRINQGGFGGGGGGGGNNSFFGGNGGPIDFAEFGGGKGYAPALPTGSVYIYGSDSTNGGGGTGAMYVSSYGSPAGGGKCLGGGGGGSGSITGSNVSARQGYDGQYAGGFVCIIANGNISGTGAIKCNGGYGGNGGDGNGTYTGGGGGGGGAGGGLIQIFYTGTYSTISTMQVNGGTGGTGGTGYSGGENGGSGTSGGIGTIYTQHI
jgi:hypothetical protein